MSKCSACGAELTRFSERLFGGCFACMTANPKGFTVTISKEGK